MACAPARSAMFVPLLIVRNAFRHKLRTALTMIGIVVAITAFGLLRTIVDAWYAGANASSSARLVTRSSVSLVFSLPLTYAREDSPGAGRALGVVGQLVRRRLHIGAQLLSAVRDRCADLPRHVPRVPVAGRPSGRRFWSIAEAPSSGASSPNSMAGRSATRSRCAARSIPEHGRSTLRGIYDGADKGTDQSTMFFHWALLNETIKKIYPRRADQTGVLHRGTARSGGGGGGFGGDRCHVQELARRDADRDREGLPALRSSR